MVSMVTKYSLKFEVMMVKLRWAAGTFCCCCCCCCCGYRCCWRWCCGVCCCYCYCRGCYYCCCYCACYCRGRCYCGHANFSITTRSKPYQIPIIQYYRSARPTQPVLFLLPIDLSQYLSLRVRLTI